MSLWQLRSQWWLAGAVAVVAIAFGLVSNVAADHLPSQVSDGVGLWITFALLGGLTVAGAILRRREARAGSTGRVTKILRARAREADHSLATVDGHDGPLDDIPGFVRVAGPPRAQQFDGPITWERVSVSDLAGVLSERQRERVIVVGEPGSGKTRVLRTLMAPYLAGKRPVPIWLSLRALPPGSSIENWIRQAIVEMGVPEPNAKALDLQKTVIFLDGLDEIPVDVLQQEAYEAIMDFARAHPLARLFVSCQSEVHQRLARSNGLWPVEIEALSDDQIVETLRQLGPPAKGLRRAAESDDNLRASLNSPLGLRSAALAFENASREQVVEAHQGRAWDDAITAKYVTSVLSERGNAEVLSDDKLDRFLRWLADILEAPGLQGVSAFVPPRALTNPDLRKARPSPARSLSVVVEFGLPFAVAGYLIVGLMTAVACFALAAVLGVWLVALGVSPLAEPADEQRWSWSGDLVRAAIPGLVVRLVAGTVALVAVQSFTLGVTARAHSLADMSAAESARAQQIVAVFLALLLARYLYGYLQHEGRSPGPISPVDLGVDYRPSPTKLWRDVAEWFDFSVAFYSAVPGLILAGAWSFGYALLGSLAEAHLRNATVESWFHQMLRFMDFPYRSPLGVDPGLTWTLLVTAVFFGAGWVIYLLLMAWSQWTAEAAHKATIEDCAIGDFDLARTLEYGRHLGLLKRQSGRYSFFHERYERYYRRVTG